MIDLSFDNGTVEQYTLVLAQRNLEHLGALSNVQHIKLKKNLNAPDELSFDIYKQLDDHEEILWDEIYDLRLVWVRELNEYYEINVASTDNVYVIKNITAKSLCESELSQTYLNKIEINTADDIAREDYDANYPTVFYRPLDGLFTNTDEYRIKKNSSLLHRVMEKVPAYTIGHVDNSLCNLQRVFSISNTNLYNFLVGECSEQFNCLFQFDSATRTISVYDLKSVCLNENCSYRGFFYDVCPKCGSSHIQYFGKDTTVFVSTENLTDEVKFETDVNSMKNCFRLEAGDDDMTAAVINSNPNGTRYIYEFNEETQNDMPEQLRELINNYDRLYDRYYNEEPINLAASSSLITSYNNLCDKYNSDTYQHENAWKKIPSVIYGYKNLIPYYYNCIDFYSYLKSGMMPDPIEEIYSIEDEVNHINDGLYSLGYTISFSSQPAVTDTVESGICNICQMFVNTGIYDVTVKTALNGITKTSTDPWKCNWAGTITLTSYEDDSITKTITYNSSTNLLHLDIDYANYMQQNISKLLKRDQNAEDIYDIITMPWNSTTQGSEFRIELAKYSSARLKSFKEAINAVLTILTQEGQDTKSTKTTTYEEIEDPVNTALKINPKKQKWYEPGTKEGEYKLTNDTYIKDDKSYYQLYVKNRYKAINLESYPPGVIYKNPHQLGWYELIVYQGRTIPVLTEDTEINYSKAYFIRHNDGGFTPIELEPEFNPHQNNWFNRKKSKSKNKDGKYEYTYYLTEDTKINYSKNYWEFVPIEKYKPVKIPTVNPTIYNWFELTNNTSWAGESIYVKTKDTSIVNGKTYYEMKVTVSGNVLYEPFYKPYKNKLTAVDKELKNRDEEATTIGGHQAADGSYDTKGILQYIVECISEIQKNLDFSNYVYNNTFDKIINPTGNPKAKGWYIKRTVGDYTEYVATSDTSVVAGRTYYEHNYSYDLYNLYTTYIREDTYSNSNYISTDLTNDQLFENAGIFLETAKDELHKSANYQHSISTNMNNLMAIPEFKPLLNKFELGNWIRVREDETTYRLRLISYSIDFDDITHLDTEFSDVTVTADGLNDVKSILSQATSMASSYSYTQQQAEAGADVMYNYIDDWVTNGLNSALIRINSNTDEDISIDNTGITARIYNDVEESYGNEQLRITHNILAFTDDNWETVSTALGKFDFEHHIINADGVNKATNPTTEETYGLVAKAVLSGWIVSSNMESSTIIASHIQNVGNSNYMDLGPNSPKADLKYFLKCGDNFWVEKDGTITAKAGNIGGVVLSSTGTSFGGIEVSGGKLNPKFSNLSEKIIIDTSNYDNSQIGEGAIVAGLINSEAICSKYYKYTSGIYSDAGTFFYLGTKNNTNSYIRSKNFAIDTSGNAYIRGNITASSGRIGNWSIQESDSEKKYGEGALHYNPGSGTSTFILSPLGTNLTGTAQPIMPGTEVRKNVYVRFGSNFAISKDGDVYMSGNGSFGGAITATSGKIGNWHITASSSGLYGNGSLYYLGDSATMGQANSTLLSPAGFTMKKTSSSDIGKTFFGWTVDSSDTTKTFVLGAGQNFGVTVTGKLFASSAEISGKIITTEAEIGGFTIDENHIRHGSTSGTNSGDVTLSSKIFTRSINGVSHTNLHLAIGAKFGVTANGVIYANDAHIAGTIEASAGKIGAWDIDTDSNHYLVGTVSNHQSWLAPGFIHIVGTKGSSWRECVINPAGTNDTGKYGIFGLGGIKSGEGFVIALDERLDHTKSFQHGDNWIRYGSMAIERQDGHYVEFWASDRRVKKNISNLTLEEAEKLVYSAIPRKFEFKSIEGIRYGFIAQELREILDDDNVIEYNGSDREDGIHSIHYSDFIPALCIITKKQQAEINELKQLINGLKGESNG